VATRLARRMCRLGQRRQGGAANAKTRRRRPLAQVVDSSLQSALVDRWRPETHTFHLRRGELTPTLKDVSLITGLLISGKPLVPIAFSSNWPDEVGVCLDTEVPNSDARGGRRPRGVPISWLT
jgi:hypothetical protein